MATCQSSSYPVVLLSLSVYTPSHISPYTNFKDGFAGNWKFYLVVMLKNILTRRKESDTYLSTVSRHLESADYGENRWNVVAFS